MVREVIVYPNKILRRKSKNVKNFDKKRSESLAEVFQSKLGIHRLGLFVMQRLEISSLLWLHVFTSAIQYHIQTSHYG